MKGSLNRPLQVPLSLPFPFPLSLSLSHRPYVMTSWEIDFHLLVQREGKALPEASLPFHRAMPSLTHMALVALERAGILKFVISQVCIIVFFWLLLEVSVS